MNSTTPWPVLTPKMEPQPSSSSFSPFAKIPLPVLEPFNQQDVTKWFVSLSTQLMLCKATSELDKYIALLGYLEPTLRTIVQDWLAEESKRRHVNDPFTFTKGKLIKRFEPSEKERLVRLMGLRPASTMLPSEYLNELRVVAGPKHETVAVEIWEDYLPEAVTAMLQTPQIIPLPLDAKALFVDSFHMANQRKIANVQTTPTTEVLPVSAVDTLVNRLDALEVMLNDRKKPFQARQKPVSRTTNAASVKPLSTQSLCWYHRKFGDKAKKCECAKKD